jgi:ABC-type transport system involved in multi-copper enzyme maturation permease subunit
MRQMVWMALLLLALSVVIVVLLAATGRWTADSFSTGMVFEVFLGFLLPMWSLSFATQALGDERESRSLVWLLTRPLPRAGIYLAKFVALLPWSIGLNLGGFALLCLAAGPFGLPSLRLYGPAILMGTLAYCALFHLMGAWFRRPAVVAIVYTFFVETFVGGLPGQMKRASISFYTRCLMLDSGQKEDLQPSPNLDLYMPVGSVTAWIVLAGVTILLLALGTWVFARTEYQDEV